MASIITESVNVINTYTDKLTLRQIYYRLVAKQIIENNISEYKYLSKVLVAARKSGQIGWDKMEDRTRSVEDHTGHYTSELDFFQGRLDDVFNAHDEYFLSTDLYQPELTIVLLEKQALEAIFDRVCRQYDAILVVCRGYNSLTQLYELYEILAKLDKPLHVRFFSDFDPTGLDIQRNFAEQAADLGMQFASFERIALTEELIAQYKLPSVPAKSTDSRAKSWGSKGVVELDALDPAVLRQLIEAAIKEHFDMAIYSEVKRLEKVLKRKLARKVKAARETFGQPDAMSPPDQEPEAEEQNQEPEPALTKGIQVIRYKCEKCGKLFAEEEEATFDGEGNLVSGTRASDPELEEALETEDPSFDETTWEYKFKDGRVVPGYMPGMCTDCRGKSEGSPTPTKKIGDDADKDDEGFFFDNQDPDPLGELDEDD